MYAIASRIDEPQVSIRRLEAVLRGIPDLEDVGQFEGLDGILFTDQYHNILVSVIPDDVDMIVIFKRIGKGPPTAQESELLRQLAECIKKQFAEVN